MKWGAGSNTDLLLACLWCQVTSWCFCPFVFASWPSQLRVFFCFPGDRNTIIFLQEAQTCVFSITLAVIVLMDGLLSHFGGNKCSICVKLWCYYELRCFAICAGPRFPSNNGCTVLKQHLFFSDDMPLSSKGSKRIIMDKQISPRSSPYLSRMLTSPVELKTSQKHFCV